MKIDKILAKIKKDIPLKKFTTFKIGGFCQYFFEARDNRELISILKMIRNKKIPFFILGQGSNVLFLDKNYKGILVLVKNSQLKILRESKKKVLLKVAAGLKLVDLISFSQKNGFSGIEELAGIPGTFGGCVAGNCGAFSKEIGDLIKKIKVFDLKEGKIKILTKKECQFSYRDSIFKKNKKLIILEGEIELIKSEPKKIKKKVQKYLLKKRERQPLNFSSAGCIFKNPKNFSAGLLIEMAGLKGEKRGKIQVSKKHANFLVNLEGGKAEDVLFLIKKIEKKIKNDFKINLEKEIIIVKNFHNL